MSTQVVGFDHEREDADLYELYDEWRLARVELQLCHAKFKVDHSDKAGHSDNVSRLCRRLESIEGQMSRSTPVSFRGLINTLTMAADILAARAIDEDGYFGSGDAFGLVACALRAVDSCEGEIGGAS